jgi:hypothetical protein
LDGDSGFLTPDRDELRRIADRQGCWRAFAKGLRGHENPAI